MVVVVVVVVTVVAMVEVEVEVKSNELSNRVLLISVTVKNSEQTAVSFVIT